MLTVIVRRGGLIALVVVCMSLATVAAADKLTDDEARYLAMLIQARDQRADEIRQKIAAIEADLASGKYVATQASKRRAPTLTTSTRRNANEEDDDVVQGNYKPAARASRVKKAGRSRIPSEIGALKSELEKTESGAIVPETHGVRLVDEGSIGYLAGPGIRVIQVIGPSDMLLSITGLSDTGREAHSFWMHGLSTKNYVDDQTIGLSELVIVDGKKSYTTVQGGNTTVRVLRPLSVDQEKVLTELRARSKANARPEIKARPKPLLKPVEASAPQDPDAAARKRFAGILSNCRALIKAGLRDAAEQKLQRIIKEAPGTSIAAEAQKELDQLANGH